MAAPLGAVLAHVLDRYNTVTIVDIASGQLSILQRNGFLVGFGYPNPLAGQIPYSLIYDSKFRMPTVFMIISMSIYPAKACRT